MKRLPIAMILAATMWACERSNVPSIPTLPSASPHGYVLSGVVFEATTGGQTPIEGARVEESTSHRVGTTDTSGLYLIYGLSAGAASVSVSKECYETVRRDVTIDDGATRLDIQVVQRPTYILSGVVTETTPAGQVPLEGVHVEWSSLHVVAMTDTNGFYSMSGVCAGETSVWVAKEGYQSGSRAVTIDGDTRFDIQVVHR